jgi:autotransporter-associated beta strand protein
MRFPRCRFAAVIAVLAVASASATAQTWTGNSTLSSDWSQLTNWSGGIPVSGTNTAITFGPTSRLTPVQNLASPFQLNRLTFDRNAGTYDLTGSALDFRVSSGFAPPEIVKNNDATPVQISQNLITNSASLALSIGSNTTLPGQGNTNGVLTLAGAISGNGAIAVANENLQVLMTNAANSFAGTLTVAAGVLRANGNVFGGTGLTQVNADAGLWLEGTGLTSAEIFRLAGNGIAGTGYAANSGGLRNVAGANTLSGAITLMQSTTVTVAGGSLTLSGNIGQDIGSAKVLTRYGPGTLTLSGANSFTGGLVLNDGGTTVFGSNTAAGSGPITIAAGHVIEAGASPVTLANAVQVNGFTHNAGTLTLSGTVNLNNAVNTTKTVSVTTGAALTISTGVAPYVLPPMVTSYPVGLTKAGGGTLTLGGSSTVEGDLVVNAGRLTLTGTATTGPAAVASGAIVDIDAGATLNGTTNFVVLNGGLVNLRGTIARFTGINGTVEGDGTIQGGGSLGTTGKFAPRDPSFKPGQITIAGGLEVRGQLEIDISRDGQNNSNGNSTPGTGFDTIPVTPPASDPSAVTNATLYATMRVTLRATNTDLTSTFWQSSKTWTVMSTTNGRFLTPDGLPPASGISLLTDLDSPVATSAFGSFSFQIEALSPTQENLNVVWTPVPEPVSFVWLAAVLTGLGLRFRARGA